MLKSRLASIDFTYSDPEANFDRSKVKGLVANLVDLDEENFSNSTALEICAGGKLYNVVVHDEKVGSKLLKNGNLRKRVTIIPLNKIDATKIAAEVSGRPHILLPNFSKVNRTDYCRNLLLLIESPPAKSILLSTSLATQKTSLPQWPTSSAARLFARTSVQPKPSRSTNRSRLSLSLLKVMYTIPQVHFLEGQHQTVEVCW